jgi:hypothetical protein
MIADIKQKEPHKRKMQKHIEEWYEVEDSKCCFDEEKEKICLVNLLSRNRRKVWRKERVWDRICRKRWKNVDLRKGSTATGASKADSAGQDK